MKKKVIIWIVAGILVFLLAALVLFDLNKGDSKDKKLTEVTLAEVTHSIFYAPQYVAIEKGYFEEVGIDIELILTSGADKVTAAVLSGDADIGFCGSEGTIYVYQGGEKDYLKTFAQLTQKDGSFIVSREKIKDFTLEDLKGKEILGGPSFDMPVIVSSYEGGGFSETRENRKRSELEHRVITRYYLGRRKSACYAAVMLATLAPVRTKIAENPSLAKGYNAVKAAIYRGGKDEPRAR